MPSAELFSKCCTPHFMESRRGGVGGIGGVGGDWGVVGWGTVRQTELNSTHSCINGSL